MTPEEAINNIEEILNSVLNYDESIDYELTSCDFDWLEIAKAAVEKQMPKKPKEFEIYDECTDYSYPTALCPKCNCEVDTNFCYNCGQAIDWSENNE